MSADVQDRTMTIRQLRALIDSLDNDNASMAEARGWRRHREALLARLDDETDRWGRTASMVELQESMDAGDDD